MDCTLSIYRKEGIFAYWKGNTINVLRYFPTSAFMFGFYEIYKRLIPERADDSHKNFLLKKMLIGGLSGSSSMIFIFPLDLLRTRITVEVSEKTSKTQPSLIKLIGHIYRQNGIKGFYQGLGMSMFSNFGYWALYFGFWDFAKKWIKDYD